MRKIKVGEMVWSKHFGAWIKVIKINSDDDWYFMFNGSVNKAKAPLSFFAGMEADVC